MAELRHCGHSHRSAGQEANQAKANRLHLCPPASKPDTYGGLPRSDMVPKFVLEKECRSGFRARSRVSILTCVQGYLPTYTCMATWLQSNWKFENVRSLLSLLRRV